MALQESLTGVVAIIDDTPRNRERLADTISRKRLEPKIIDGPLVSVDQLVRDVRNIGATYAICDHRLFEKRYAPFYGAEAVAAFYETHAIAPLLVTSYETADADTTIRRFRRYIPTLLHTKDLSSETILEGLLLARSEVVNGVYSSEREPCPAILTVLETCIRGNEKVVRVIVAQWDPHVEVGFPLAMIPQEIQKAVLPGAFLYADVNVDAKRAEDLYFTNFSLPNSDDVRKAATYINHP